MFVEVKLGKNRFRLVASVRGEGLKNICSNLPGAMGNTWEKIGFIRSAK